MNDSTAIGIIGTDRAAEGVPAAGRSRRRIGQRCALSLSIRRRKVLLVGVDLLTIAIAWSVALAALSGQRLILVPQWPMVSGVVVFTVAWLIAAATFDAHDFRIASALRSSTAALAKTACVATGTLCTYLWLFDGAFWLLPGVLLAVTLPAGTFGRVCYAVIADRICRQSVIIIGTAAANEKVVNLLNMHGGRTFDVTAVISVDRAPSPFDPSADVAELLGAVLAQGIEDIVLQHAARMLIVTSADLSTAKLREVIRSRMPLQTVPAAALYEHLTGRVSLETLGTDAEALMRGGSGQAIAARGMKRAMDLILVSIGLCGLAVALPFIALAIKIDSKGPVIYTQERVGRGGVRFRVFKFRSMVANAESGTAIWARVGDPRVTRVGQILRRTHLDEFPQFLNILKGEMSVVGPRPERPEFVEQLGREIPFYDLRHIVKPGMAGWGLVQQGYGSTVEGARVKLEHDLYYVKHQSIWLDIVIFCRTLVDSISLRGRA